MHGLMMDSPLTLDVLLRRVETLFGGRPVTTRTPSHALWRATWGDVAARARRLAAGLAALGVGPGDRVATLACNHQRHLEAYFGIPLTGAVLHTLNLRLHPSELHYIIGHAGDRIVLVDEALFALLDRVHPSVRDMPLVVLRETDAPLPPDTLDYEDVLASGDTAWAPPPLDERQAASMCYTTGTTGAPKGVVYSHRSIVLHSLTVALPDVCALTERDICMPVVPMFHVNAWGLPYAAAVTGTGLALPGPYLDAESLLDLVAAARVTTSAGVPTIWRAVLAALDAAPGRWDLSSLERLFVGGAAAPPALIEGFDRHGIPLVHAWGMTETSPVGTLSRVPPDLAEAPEDECLRVRAMQGRALPLIEVRARGERGIVPWDGRTMGELEVRGPWVAASYYNAPDAAAAFTDDGWLRTGDIATIDARGYVQIQDRAKDLVKSGGEWISSIALENALMGHPAVREAAVIAIPDEVWGERPLAVMVFQEGRRASSGELRSFIAPLVARWWLPDHFAAVPEIPRTSAGKFNKIELRARWAAGTLAPMPA